MPIPTSVRARVARRRSRFSRLPSRWAGARRRGGVARRAGRGGSARRPGAGADVDAGDPDPDPTFTSAQMGGAPGALARVLCRRPRADVTNSFADDAAAAALGQTLFYDPSFSGPLLDTDNDGSPGTLGAAGQTGRVGMRRVPPPEERLLGHALGPAPNLARGGLGKAPRALAPRRWAGDARDVGRQARHPLRPDLRAARDRRRDEQLPPLCRRADLREIPGGVRGGVRPDAAARRHDAVPGAAAPR